MRWTCTSNPAPCAGARGLALALLGLVGASAAHGAPPPLKGVVGAPLAKRLAPAARAALESDGFVVVSGRERHFFALYDANAYAKIPSFVTTDVVLHAFHVRFDEELAALERTQAAPALEAFAKAQLAAAFALFPKSGAPEPRLENLALYHAVPLRLLNREAPVDARLAAKVGREVEAIDALQGAGAEICPGGLDYGFFKPRGHYDRGDLRGYFQASTFYSQCAFSLREAERIGRALDIVRLVDPAARAQLAIVQKLRRLIVGQPDDPDLDVLLGMNLKMSPLPARAGAAAVSTVMGGGEALRGKVATLAAGPVFRLLGGAGVADSVLFSRTAGTAERQFPSVLDVLAALGSARARTRLEPDLKRAPALAAELGKPWSSGAGVYGRWLSVLGVVVGSPPPGQPPFAASERFADRVLVSAAGSWAELRHDTILYVAQPMVMMQGGHEAELPAAKAGGYVEPRPDVYRALRSLLGELDTLGGGPASPYRQGLDELLGFLIEVSELELAQKPFPKAVDERLRGIGTLLEYLTRGHADELPDQALVADVFTSVSESGGQSVLHAAIGDVDEMWVVVPRGKARVLMRGGVFSYYEIVPEPGVRLSDGEWRARLRGTPTPSRPPWATVEAAAPARKD